MCVKVVKIRITRTEVEPVRWARYYDMNDVDISEEEHEENENENSLLREVYIFPRKKAYRGNP